MKVILLQDVAKVGLKHDTVDVPNGYALNKLIPNHLAVPATSENQKRMKRQLEEREAANVAMDKAYADAVGELANKTVTVQVEVNEKGHMFEALKVEKIAEAAKANGVEILPEMIEIEAPIKEVGEFTVMLTSGTDKQPFILKVESV